MKERYEQLKMEVIAFEAEDIITASRESTPPEDPTYLAGDAYTQQ